MPASVERCVASLTAKWKKDPSSRPAAKDGKTAEQQAWAICNAAQKRGVQNSLAEMLDLEDGGAGPALIGAAATNRPYIPKLKATRVVEGEGGKKMLQVHLANSGYFNHPTGPFVLNRTIFLTMKDNFHKKVVGQDVAYDCRHKPDEGAYGWFKELMLGDEIGEGSKEFWGLVDPTKVGLERIEGGEFKYSSMEFHRNFNRSDVTLDLEDATLDFCVVDLEQPEENVEEETGDMEDENMSDEKETVSLEEYKKAQDELERIKAEKKEADDRAEKAIKAALKLQQDAIKTEVSAVVNLAQTYRDSDGKALPRKMVEWVQKFLSMEEIGTDDNVVRLEEGKEVSLELRRYIIGSVKNLILEMPGIVPAERLSHDGASDEEDEEDKFDFVSLWEDKK